jgi:hypothetical protein
MVAKRSDACSRADHRRMRTWHSMAALVTVLTRDARVRENATALVTQWNELAKRNLDDGGEETVWGIFCGESSNRR